jgi:hypothetical protein
MAAAQGTYGPFRICGEQASWKGGGSNGSVGRTRSQFLDTIRCGPVKFAPFESANGLGVIRIDLLTLGIKYVAECSLKDDGIMRETRLNNRRVEQ